MKIALLILRDNFISVKQLIKVASEWSDWIVSNTHDQINGALYYLLRRGSLWEIE